MGPHDSHDTLVGGVHCCRYFEKAFADYTATALAPADPPRAFGLWSTDSGLFWRDARFVNSSIFWGRGNGWAVG
eukprot:COSAG01_NODE_57783_length_310_cov_0.725118_1_plen_73_part_10